LAGDRLDAETLRDQALFISGLLVEKRGGPGVKPPQPSGLWEAVGYVSSNTRNFVADTGREKVHRRSLYTFWKRTAPPPQMSTFDAPSREACFVRRERTNTPLQALLLLNETQYVECARALAERAMRQGGRTPEERITFMFRQATLRKPDQVEMTELLAAFRDHLAEYQRYPGAARKFNVGETHPDPALDPSELRMDNDRECAAQPGRGVEQRLAPEGPSELGMIRDRQRSTDHRRECRTRVSGPPVPGVRREHPRRPRRRRARRPDY
jgi:hypothetical protein